MVPSFLRSSGLLLAACLAASGASVRADDFGQEAERERRQTLAPAFSALKAAPQAPDPASAWTVTFDTNVPVELKRQMFGDFDFIEGLQGSAASPLHWNIFGSLAGASYRRFFLDRVHTVGAIRCGPSMVIACVLYKIDPVKIWIAPGYTLFNTPQIYRINTLLHEARHTEAAHDFWPHETCPVPFHDQDGKDIKGIFSGAIIAGLHGCDVTPLGSYGVGIVFLKNISNYCTSCTDKVRMDAGFYADDTMKRIIDPSAKKTLRDDLYR